MNIIRIWEESDYGWTLREYRSTEIIAAKVRATEGGYALNDGRLFHTLDAAKAAGEAADE